MPREMVGFNAFPARYDHLPYVLTVTPRLNATPQYGFRALSKEMRFDKAVVAPARVERGTSLRNLGQLPVRTLSTSDKNYSEVYVDDSQQPVIFLLTHEDLLRSSLYPHTGEDPIAAMQRIVFFNQAVVSLLREAEISPRILHCIDWPTAPAIAFLKRGQTAVSPPRFLFTYLDARYQGLVPRESWRLTELPADDAFFARHLDYHGGASLAKLGLMAADLTVTGSKAHIEEVVSGRRAEGGDWGDFSKIFTVLQRDRRLRFLFHSSQRLEDFGRMNLEAPTEEEKDSLLDVASRYQLLYRDLYQEPQPDGLSLEHLQAMVVRKTIVDLRPLANLQSIMESDFLTAEEKVLIGRVCHDFGSIELVDFLYPRLNRIDFLNRGPLTENMMGERGALEGQVKTLLTQLQALEQDMGITWGTFKGLARKTIVGRPKSFLKLEAIEPYDLTRERTDVIEEGRRFLTSGDSPYSPLMVLTLAGGLGQRFGLGEAPKGEFVTPGQPLSLFEQQARGIARLSQQTGKKIFWTVMTSRDNHEATRQHFESKRSADGKYFGVLDPETVLFVQQGNNPGVKKKGDSIDIHILENGEVFSAANGHGGFYEVASRALAEIREKFGFSPEEVVACNIDNVLFNYQLGNIKFVASWIGYKRQRKDQVTGLTTAKSSPREEMGIVARGDGVEQVIEYNHPSFSIYKAFAYESEKRGEVFFVRDAKRRVLVLGPSELEEISHPSARDENWSEGVKKLTPGYTLLELGEISERDMLYPTQVVDDRLTTSGSPFLLSSLGGVKLKYRQGNTNIFFISRDFIELVRDNPALMLSEEFKPGRTPYEQDGVRKVERLIFGPLAAISLYEATPEVFQNAGRYLNRQGELGISIVVAPREICFAPIKEPPDVSTASAALQSFLQRFPELRLAEGAT